MLAAGVEIEPKKSGAPVSASPAYRSLEEMGRTLLEVIQRNRGGTNKDLKKFADQIMVRGGQWDR